MNRRGFLGFLTAAPVAIPAAVKEAAKGFASGGYVPTLYGQGVAGCNSPLAFGESTSEYIIPNSIYDDLIRVKPMSVGSLNMEMEVDATLLKRATEEFGMTIGGPQDAVSEVFDRLDAMNTRTRTDVVQVHGQKKYKGMSADLDVESPPLVPLPDYTIAPTHWVQVLSDYPSRRAFDLMNPDPSFVDFTMLAYALVRMGRFGNQTKQNEPIYSVLQHEVEGAYAILRDTGNRKAAAAFLIHDHHEGYIGDQVTPVQRALQAHAVLVTGDLEAGKVVRDALASLRSTLDCAIYTAAGLEWPLDPETRRIVKEYDLRMCRTERDARMQPAPFSWHPSIEDAEPVTGCYLGAVDPDIYIRKWHRLARDLLPALGGHL